MKTEDNQGLEKLLESLEEEDPKVTKLMKDYMDYEALSDEEKKAFNKDMEKDKKLFVLNSFAKQLESNLRLSKRNVKRQVDRKAKELGIEKI